ncbi:hypothetical protein K2Z84_22045, partial [Candidatus Binatia bacterium]|nr:hypothetical protein [Candidatus Binatia bacterium]
MPSSRRRSRGVPDRTLGWHPGWLRGVPSEMGEWLGFAVLRDPRAETPLKLLLESYDLYAASEGLPAIADIHFVRHLEALGCERRGATFLGLRVHAAIPPLRLLTKLEVYGFRFVTRGGELAWRGPAVVSDLEVRVLKRHRHELARALHQVEETRALLRGGSLLPSPLPLRIARR